MLVVNGEGKIFDNRRKKQRRADNVNKSAMNQERRKNEDRRKIVQTRGRKKG